MMNSYFVFVFAAFTICCTAGKKLRLHNTFNFSMDDDLAALRQMKNDIQSLKLKSQTFCEPIEVGIGYGAHMICPHFLKESFPCHSISFGIQHDYSFDTALYTLKNCSGIGGSDSGPSNQIDSSRNIPKSLSQFTFET
jgi:hypothetical protein